MAPGKEATEANTTVIIVSETLQIGDYEIILQGFSESQNLADSSGPK